MELQWDLRYFQQISILRIFSYTYVTVLPHASYVYFTPTRPSLSSMAIMIIFVISAKTKSSWCVPFEIGMSAQIDRFLSRMICYNTKKKGTFLAFGFLNILFYGLLFFVLRTKSRVTRCPRDFSSPASKRNVWY